MDASDGLPNGPRPPYKPVRFQRIDLRRDSVAYAGGATHGAAPGAHGPIGVALTRDGQVWTWGMVLGDPPTLASRWQDLGLALARALHFKARPTAPPPVFRQQPWQLRNE
jgi:hypothetical protein